jgi:hypothetical protein
MGGMTKLELLAALDRYGDDAVIRIGTAGGDLVPVWRVSPGVTSYGADLAVIEALDDGDGDEA